MAVNHKPPKMPMELKILNQLSGSHCAMSPILPWEGQLALEVVRNVALGVDQEIARQADDAFIRAATGRRRQLGGGGIRDVNADDGEVAAFKLPNVRAAPAGGGLRSILVRVRAEAFDKSHAGLLL